MGLEIKKISKMSLMVLLNDISHNNSGDIKDGLGEFEDFEDVIVGKFLSLILLFPLLDNGKLNIEFVNVTRRKR